MPADDLAIATALARNRRDVVFGPAPGVVLRARWAATHGAQLAVAAAAHEHLRRLRQQKQQQRQECHHFLPHEMSPRAQQDEVPTASGPVKRRRRSRTESLASWRS